MPPGTQPIRAFLKQKEEAAGFYGEVSGVRESLDLGSPVKSSTRYLVSGSGSGRAALDCSVTEPSNSGKFH